MHTALPKLTRTRACVLMKTVNGCSDAALSVCNLGACTPRERPTEHLFGCVCVSVRPAYRASRFGLHNDTRCSIVGAVQHQRLLVEHIDSCRCDLRLCFCLLGCKTLFPADRRIHDSTHRDCDFGVDGRGKLVLVTLEGKIVNKPP